MAFDWKRMSGGLGLGGMAAIAIAVAVAVGGSSLRADDLSDNLNEVAADMEKLLPIQITEEEKLVGVSTSGKKFTLHHEVVHNSVEEGGIEAMKQAYQEMQDANLCKNEEFKKMLRLGVDLRTTWTTKDGKTFETPITNEAMARCPG